MRSLLLGTVMMVGGCGYLEDATTVPVDYDVDLVEPVEFDGSQAVAPAALDVAVSDDSPTAAIAVPDAASWGPLLYTNQQVEAAGGDRIFSIRSASPPIFTGAMPVQFAVDVSSANDVVWNNTLSPDPVNVASCSFTLDPATAAPDDFGIALENCVVDWADRNGIPAQLALEVTASTAAAGGGDTFSLTSSHTMSTTSAVEIDCELEIALPDSVIERLDNITFDAIELDAVGAANDAVSVGWFGFLFDSEGTRVASGWGFDALAAGDTREFHAVVASAGDDATVSGDASVELSPADPAAFLDNAINALSGAATGAPGGGVACWFSIGDVPRSGSLSVSISGVARAGSGL